MKKKLTIISIITILAVILAGSFFLFSKNKANAQIKNTAINFTQLLIEGKTKEATDLATGTVKFNLATNPPQKSSYQYINGDAQVEIPSPNLAIVHVAATYKAENVLNMSFSKIYLIKKDNSYFVYQVEEENPVMPKGNSKSLSTETFLPVFQSYLTGIEKQDYKKAGEVLIGKAKKSHDSTSQYLQKTKLVQSISDIKADVIYSSPKQSVVTFSYTNDNRSISTIVYFYNTVEGWRIYDLSQI